MSWLARWWARENCVRAQTLLLAGGLSLRRSGFQSGSIGGVRADAPHPHIQALEVVLKVFDPFALLGGALQERGKFGP